MVYAILFLIPFIFHANSFLQKPYHTEASLAKIRLLAITNTSKGGTRNKKKSNKKIKKKKGKPSISRSKQLPVDNTLNNDPPNGKFLVEKGSFSPFLVDYESNRNLQINKFRLLDDKVRCPHHPNCPSCVFPEVGNIPIIESAKQFFSSTIVRQNRRDVLEHSFQNDVATLDDGFLEVVVPSDLKGWRTQAKLVVQSPGLRSKRDHQGCEFGLYRKGTHTVIPIPKCSAHHPSINEAAKALKDATQKARTTAYSEDLRRGGLRYVQLRVERSTGKVCLTLVWNSKTLQDAQPHLARLVKELTKKSYDDNLWHSIWCHLNDGSGNAIFRHNPNSWHRLMGPEYMREPLSSGESDCNDGWLYFTPQTFRQGNMEGFDILAKDVARAIPGGSKVCELYAGVGLLGLTALAYHHDLNDGDENKSLQWIRCSDENPYNLNCFARAVKSLDPGITRVNRDIDPHLPQARNQVPSKPQSKASYLTASAAQALISGQALGANVLIVDPPRKGLEVEVLDELCRSFDPSQPSMEMSDLALTDRNVVLINDVELLIYVSCGFKALARDSERLLGSGNWILESATGYVLFPGSNHVETLCIFSRSKS